MKLTEMKQRNRIGKSRSLAGSHCDTSDEDDVEVLCYSPEDEDQQRRFCDLVALALAASGDRRSSQSASISWDGEDSDCESHPSLKSDAEAELLDLFDDDDEDENDVDFREASSLSSPTVIDMSYETCNSEIIQNRKSSLLSRQQRQHRAFLEDDSFCTNHAKLLSPELLILVERILSRGQRVSSKRSPNAKSRSRSGDLDSIIDNQCQPSQSKHLKLEEVSVLTPERMERNAKIIESIRETVYSEFETRLKDNRSETDSTLSPILPVSPSLLAYRNALATRSCSQKRTIENRATSAKTPNALHINEERSLPHPYRIDSDTAIRDSISDTVQDHKSSMKESMQSDFTQLIRPTGSVSQSTDIGCESQDSAQIESQAIFRSVQLQETQAFDSKTAESSLRESLNPNDVALDLSKNAEGGICNFSQVALHQRSSGSALPNRREQMTPGNDSKNLKFYDAIATSDTNGDRLDREIRSRAQSRQVPTPEGGNEQSFCSQDKDNSGNHPFPEY